MRRRALPAGRPQSDASTGSLNDEHFQIAARLPFENVLDCGGPPQARPSGWRQQQHHADGISMGVEDVPELVKVGGSEIG
jgi:hypothetical protein